MLPPWGGEDFNILGGHIINVQFFVGKIYGLNEILDPQTEGESYLDSYNVAGHT